MKRTSLSKRLRIYIAESDMCEGRPLVEVLMSLAKDQDMAGLTATRAQFGYGTHYPMQSSVEPERVERIPVVVEIVDEADKIDYYSKSVAPLVIFGLMTEETVSILKYNAHPRVHQQPS